LSHGPDDGELDVRRLPHEVTVRRLLIGGIAFDVEHPDGVHGVFSPLVPRGGGRPQRRADDLSLGTRAPGPTAWVRQRSVRGRGGPGTTDGGPVCRATTVLDGQAARA